MSPILARSLPFGIYIAFLVLEGAVPAWLPDLDVRWLYPVKVGLVALALLLLWRHYSELKTDALSWRVAGASALLGLVVFVLWINLDASWMLLDEMGPGFNPSRPDGGIDWTLVVLRIIGAALIVPVMEELFWRSFIQRWVQQKDFLALAPERIGWVALLLASALFAVEHVQWFAGLIAGLAYGWLYIRTRTIWAPIVAHAVTNGALGVYVVMSGNWSFW